MTTKYVVVPYVRVPPDEIDDLDMFDTFDEANSEVELQTFQMGGFNDAVYKVEEIEVHEDGKAEHQGDT